MNKSYIWPLVNRISHIMLIVFLAVSYTLGNYKDFMNTHIEFGIALGVAFTFRAIWGFIGPRYSRFKDFNFSITDLKNYMLNTLDYFLSTGKKGKEHVGHNPASSFAIVAMILLTYLAILSGLLAQGIEKNHGIFSFLHSAYFKQMELFSGAHSFFANALIWIVAAHVAGSLVDKYIKKSDAIDSMINGYKKTKETIFVKLNIFQMLFAILWIVVSLFSLYYMIFTKDNVLLASSNVKQNYALQHPAFAKECADCHMLYPPFFLPKKSWDLMMSDLTNHFGEDASLDKETTQSIAAFLRKNSAEHSTQEIAFRVAKDLKNKDNIISVTKTRYWKHMHDKINDAVFKSDNVKSKANCAACHKDSAKGLLDNELIKVPELKG